MKPAFELFQHTADMGIRAIASSFEELLEAGARGLYSIIGELACTETPEKEVELSFFASDRAALFRDFLAELLFLFSVKSQVAGSITVIKFTESELIAHIGLKTIDREASVVTCEVKAVTYHELRITQHQSADRGQYVAACVIVDI